DRRGAEPKMINVQKNAPRSCFISAPFGYSTEILEQLLREANVATQRFDKLDIGSDLIATLDRQIRETDLVLGIMPEGKNVENVIFELGFAIALHQPTLLLTEPKTRIPLELGQTQSMLTQLQSADALRVTVEGIINNRRFYATSTKHV